MNDYLYISIPKTGTNSVHKVTNNKSIKFNHITCKVIKQILGDEIFNSKTTFCFIRNPVELVKSWYYYHKYNPRVSPSEGRLYYPDSIDDWVLQHNCKTHWQELKHKNKNPYWNTNESPLYQYNWITDDAGEIIVKEIYKFDNFNNVIKAKFNESIDKNNQSNKDDYELKEQTLKRIKKIFEKDIKMYNNLKF